jgi:hypothetical protein
MRPIAAGILLAMSTACTGAQPVAGPTPSRLLPTNPPQAQATSALPAPAGATRDRIKTPEGPTLEIAIWTNREGLKCLGVETVGSSGSCWWLGHEPLEWRGTLWPVAVGYQIGRDEVDRRWLSGLTGPCVREIEFRVSNSELRPISRAPSGAFLAKLPPDRSGIIVLSLADGRKVDIGFPPDPEVASESGWLEKPQEWPYC